MEEESPPDDEAAVILVTHEAGECVYDGPSQFQAGDVEIRFLNNSDDDVGLDFSRLDEGKTWDDYVAYVDSDEAASGSPQWVTTVAQLNRDTEGLENRGELVEETTMIAGEHALTCILFPLARPAMPTALASIQVTAAE